MVEELAVEGCATDGAAELAAYEGLEGHESRLLDAEAVCVGAVGVESFVGVEGGCDGACAQSGDADAAAGGFGGAHGGEILARREEDVKALAARCAGGVAPCGEGGVPVVALFVEDGQGGREVLGAEFVQATFGDL